HQNDAIEVFGEAALEEQRNIADDDLIATSTCFIHQTVAHDADLGMNNGVERFELFGIAEYPATQLWAVQCSVWRQHRGAPAAHDLVEGSGARIHGSPGEHVGVDYCRAMLGE